MIKFRDLIVVLVGYIICFYLMDLSWSLFQETNIWLRLLIVDFVGTIFIYICSNIGFQRESIRLRRYSKLCLLYRSVASMTADRADA